MNLKDIGMRRAILNLERYKPGKPIAELKREIPGLVYRRIIKLASNENPLGPSPKALRAIANALPELHRYPESTSPLLREKLARHHAVDLEEVIVGSGADEILRLVVETLLEPNDRVVVSQYAFSRFRQNVQLAGSCVLEVPMKNYKHDLLAMANAAKQNQAKVIFVANPNNPTGTFNSVKELRKFFDCLGPNGPWVVHDEAYFHFALDAWPKDYPRTLPGYRGLYPKLIVVRTLSKIVGLAGLRVGYAVANRGLIAAMDRARLVFNVSSLAQIGAAAALEDKSHIKRTLRVVREGRVFLTKKLEALGFGIVQPNAANFLFVKVPMFSGKRVFEALLKQGIIVRPQEDPGIENFIRITIGLEKENRALISAIKKIFFNL